MEKAVDAKEKSKKEFWKSYCESIGVSFGNLYFRNVDKEIKLRLPTIAEIEIKEGEIATFLYDKVRGNIHMMPDDINLAQLCSDYIHDKGNDILNWIKELTEKDKSYQSISCNQKSLSHASKVELKNCMYLFSYASVTCNNTKYDLIFNRFYFDENYKVINCILLCPQIEMYDKSLTESTKRDEENSPRTKDYPKTSKPKQGNAAYYNFEVDIDSSSKDIAEKFLKFVIDTEEKKQADGEG